MLFKKITLSLCFAGFAALATAQSFSFGACADPNAGLPGNFPRFAGEIKLDGVDAAVGSVVGVFDADGKLLGTGEVYTDNFGAGDVSFVDLGLQTDPQGILECGAFTAGDEVTVRLQFGGGSVIDQTNSTFLGTTFEFGGQDYLNGPDGNPDFDVYDFDSNTLPVTLTNFSATPNSNKVDLSWSTSSETENSHFEVQRSTTPNGDFQNIGKVLGNATTTAANSYGFTDNNPAEGTNYYRLQQFDFDGTNEFSPIVVADIAVSAERSVAVFPNPAAAGSRMTVRLNGNWTAGGANLELVDANGRKVANWNGLGNGSLNTELPVLKAGIYQLIATDGKERQTTRVVVR